MSSVQINEIDHAPLTPEERKRGFFFLTIFNLMVGFTFAMVMGLGANYIANVMGATPAQVGWFEGLRETCGITALAVLAILAGFSEPRVTMAMTLIMALGLAGYYFPEKFGWTFILTGMVWSMGLHVWMPLPRSMALAMAEEGRQGRRLAQLRRAMAAGQGLGLLLAYLLLKFAGVTLRQMYLVAAAGGVVGALSCLGIPRNIKTPGPRFVFRRKYGLYYILCFLDGWRKQIFVAFAAFMLITRYQTPVTTIVILFGVVQIFKVLVSPHVGNCVDRLGERRVLVFYFAGVLLLFLGYALIPFLSPYVITFSMGGDSYSFNLWLYLLFAIFVLDNALFVFNIALTTYVGRLAPKNEYTPTLSMGVAFNHVAAVAMPLVGGLLWMSFGPAFTFLSGALAALLSVVVVLRVPERSQPHR